MVTRTTGLGPVLDRVIRPIKGLAAHANNLHLVSFAEKWGASTGGGVKLKCDLLDLLELSPHTRTSRRTGWTCRGRPDAKPKLNGFQLLQFGLVFEPYNLDLDTISWFLCEPWNPDPE